MLKYYDLMLIMSIISAIVIIVSIVILIKRFSRGERKYDVFMIDGDKLIILSGIPIKYNIDDIELIIFSKRHQVSTWMGFMKVIKKGSLINRKFWFDGSSYRRTMELDSTEAEIDIVTDDLMAKLRSHGIRCKKKDE